MNTYPTIHSLDLVTFRSLLLSLGTFSVRTQRRWNLLLSLILANILSCFAWNPNTLAPSAHTPLQCNFIRTGWAWLHPWTLFLKACPFLSLIHLSAPGCWWGLQFTCSFVLFSQTPNCPEVSFKFTVKHIFKSIIQQECLF